MLPLSLPLRIVNKVAHTPTLFLNLDKTSGQPTESRLISSVFIIILPRALPQTKPCCIKCKSLHLSSMIVVFGKFWLTAIKMKVLILPILLRKWSETWIKSKRHKAKAKTKPNSTHLDKRREKERERRGLCLVNLTFRLIPLLLVFTNLHPFTFSWR